jgi:hypothetical protein
MDENWQFYWQDFVATLAALWMMATVPGQIATASVFAGWLAYIGGALVLLLVAASLADRSPNLSWVAAFAGLVLVATPLMTGILDDALATASFMAAGAIIVVFSVWSALVKRGEAEPRRRSLRGERAVRA